MPTLISALLFNSLFLFSVNIWALSDRALFRLGDKVFFQSEAGLIVESYKYLQCENYNLELVDNYLGLKLDSLSQVELKEDRTHTKLSNKDIRTSKGIAELVQLIRYSKASESPRLSKKKACGFKREYMEYVPFIIGSRQFLRKSVISSNQDVASITESLKGLKRSLNREDKIRLYFND